MPTTSSRGILNAKRVNIDGVQNATKSSLGMENKQQTGDYRSNDADTFVGELLSVGIEPSYQTESNGMKRQ